MKSVTFDRASLCNVVLLGFFALGLGLAVLMVRFRSAIELSEPLPLTGEGLSVSVPIGAGWESLTEWTYERDNSFTLASAFSVQGPPTAEVRWQLKLAEKPLRGEDLLIQYASRFAGQVGEMQIFESAVTFFWAHLFPRTSNEELLLAVAVLDNGRVLLLQLRSYAEPLYIRDLFEHLANSVQIQPDPRRLAGKRLSAELSRHMYPVWLEEIADQPSVFLLLAPDGMPLGYSRTTAAAADSSESLPYGIDCEQTFRGSSPEEHITWQFRSDEDLSEFTWTTTRRIRRRTSQTALHLQTDGTLQIRDSYGRQETFWPAPGAVPEILLPALTRSMINSSETEILIDVISSSGWIVPAALSKLTPLTASQKIEQAAQIIKVDYLHDPDNYDEYYFDNDGILVARYEHQLPQSSRLWNRATMEDILLHFGELSGKPQQSVKQDVITGRDFSMLSRNHSQ